LSGFYPEDRGSRFSETLVPIYQTIRHHIPEDYNLERFRVFENNVLTRIAELKEEE
jgi:hypothetical protein